VLLTQTARRVLRQRIAVSLAVGRPHEGGDDFDVPVVNLGRLAPEIGQAEVDIELEQVDAARACRHGESVETRSDDSRRSASVGRQMGELKFGPARVPSRASPEAAIALLEQRGYTACEIDFEGKFWMDYPWAERFGALAEKAEIVLSVHAPIAGFLGQLERDKKHRMAIGMLDHSAGIAVACGAELVVFHPGFLLGRERAEAIDAVCEQLGELRERLEGKGRAVPFGVEIMGRVRELGTPEDVFAIAARTGWIRPVLDFAHLHAVTDGGFTDADPFTEILERADEVSEPAAPFHVHFSDIAFANRNETKHLPYGEGTLRAGPLAEALARFERPATVISESPDEGSHQAIRAVLEAAASSPRRRSKASASSSRPRSRKT
jgi:deoxyribonuclease IV